MSDIIAIFGIITVLALLIVMVLASCMAAYRFIDLVDNLTSKWIKMP